MALLSKRLASMVVTETKIGQPVYGASLFTDHDIYLFKDSNIAKEHAIIDLAGSRIMLRAIGETYVNGQPVRQQVLMSGAVVQIGRYAFRYQERQRN